LAREKGMHYNEYIASLCDEMLSGHTKNRGSVINARVDSIVKVEAEKILQQLKLSPSEAVEKFYIKIIEDGNIQFVEKPPKKD
jgi:addiction module RelB/DinJ family antitoxin